MSEFSNRYYPTICIRRAEMKGLENLPVSEKELMLPIVLLAPWLNSIEFENTFKVVEKSIGNIPIIADLDRHFRSTSDLPSRQTFREFLNGDEGVEKWMGMIETKPNFIPTIRVTGISDHCVYDQISWARALGRGFVFRIELQLGDDPKRHFELLQSCINDDVLTVIDYGYQEESLELTAKLTNHLRELVDIDANFKFVVSGSNFPNTFSDYDDFSRPKAIGSRLTYSELARQFNNYQFYYGDWASTKPRRYDGGGSRPLPRIDYPTRNAWIIARSKEEEWTFRDAAVRVTRLTEWQTRPSVWGAGLIEKTAEGLPGGISTGPMAIAARVNIHLFQQNHYRDTAPPPVPEGEWVDPI